MSKFRFAFTILVAFTVLCTSSCDDKININADYTTTPIIFGLLDHTDSVHMIKITKTFLGEGNNFDFAKVPDSSYFRSVAATITELKDGSPTGRKWQLKDSTVKNKADGIFYNPEQKVYVFYEKNLRDDHEYKLEASMNEGQYNVDATTTLIEGFKYDNFFLSTQDFTFASANGNRIPFNLRYDEGRNGKGYQSRITLNYKVTYQDNSEENKSIVWSARSNNGINVDDVDPDNPRSRSISFRGEDFFNFIDAQLSEDENVKSRQIIDFDLVTEIGHKDLMKYIEVAKPTTSLAQNSPTFTNINGGLGLFSSRQIARRTGMGISPPSLEALITSEPTNVYKFCSHLPSHQDRFFYCF